MTAPGIRQPRGLLLALLLAAALAFAALPARGDVPVTIAYTADNVVGAWWQNGGSAASQTVGPNAGNWRLADSATLSLTPGHDYQFIWRVQNSGTPSDSNPAGFLAEIACEADPNYDVVSHAVPAGRWQWAVAGTTEPSDFNTLTWTAVTAFSTGGTDAWNGGDNIWTSVNNGPVGGIASGSGGAYWIWADSNTDSAYSDIYIRYNGTGIELVPEPFGASLLALSSALLLIRRRRRN